MNALPVVIDLKHIGLEACSLAVRTGDVYIRKKLHLHFFEAIAIAGFTAPAGHVKRKVTGAEIFCLVRLIFDVIRHQNIAMPHIQHAAANYRMRPVLFFSHGYFKTAYNLELFFDLAATLSIRNTNLKSSIIIVSVIYYDSAGKMIKDYLDGPIKLDALASTRYIIKENDKAGGSGANFIVLWQSEKKVNPPIIEGSGGPRQRD